MKIVGIADSALDEGDFVSVSLNHEIKIGREVSWVKFEATSKVRPDESSEAARDRVLNYVEDAVMIAVEETVKRVQEKTK